MLEMYRNPLHQGLYHQPHADAQGRHHGLRDVCAGYSCRPSRTGRSRFEVFADEFEEMERQAREIATWGEHVYVKIPVTNTRGEGRRMT